MAINSEILNGKLIISQKGDVTERPRGNPIDYIGMEGSLEKLFQYVINIRGVQNELGMNESTVRALRKKCNDGTPISVEKMREVLTKAGYKMEQEERWGK